MSKACLVSVRSSLAYELLGFNYLMSHASLAATLLAVSDHPQDFQLKVVLPCVSNYPMVIHENPSFKVERAVEPLGCEASVSLVSRGIRPQIRMKAEIAYNQPQKTTFIKFEGVPMKALFAASRKRTDEVDLRVVADYLTFQSMHSLDMLPLIVREFGDFGEFRYRPSFTDGDAWHFKGLFTTERESHVSKDLVNLLSSTLVDAWNSINQ